MGRGYRKGETSRATVAAQLGVIAKTNGPFASNRARASLSALFTWVMGEGLAETNPVIGTNKATEEISRDHVISDGELKSIWQASRDDDHGRIVFVCDFMGCTHDARLEAWSGPTDDLRPASRAEVLARFPAADLEGSPGAG